MCQNCILWYFIFCFVIAGVRDMLYCFDGVVCVSVCLFNLCCDLLYVKIQSILMSFVKNSHRMVSMAIQEVVYDIRKKRNSSIFQSWALNCGLMTCYKLAWLHVVAKEPPHVPHNCNFLEESPSCNILHNSEECRSHHAARCWRNTANMISGTWWNIVN